MPPSLSGLRASFARGLRWSDSHAMLLWAALAGIVGASATIAFREGISGLQWLMVRQHVSLVDMARGLDWPLRIAIPTLGGVVAGLLLAWARRIDTGETKPDRLREVASSGVAVLYKPVSPRALRQAIGAQLARVREAA